jgi:hypothetical protein
VGTKDIEIAATIGEQREPPEPVERAEGHRRAYQTGANDDGRGQGDAEIRRKAQEQEARTASHTQGKDKAAGSDKRLKAAPSPDNADGDEHRQMRGNDREQVTGTLRSPDPENTRKRHT